MPARVLIATDADVRGLLACAAAAREHGPGQLVWLPPGADQPLLPHCEAAAGAQAETFEHTCVHSPEVPLTGSCDGERQTRLLLDAAWLAQGRRVETVVWAGTALANQQDQIDLDALITLHSRALLVERLIGLDTPSEFRLRIPYADLTDRQLADLVLDMDLPIWTCWWWSLGRGPRSTPGTELARIEYERWDALLKEAGWREGMPGPAKIG